MSDETTYRQGFGGIMGVIPGDKRGAAIGGQLGTTCKKPKPKTVLEELNLRRLSAADKLQRLAKEVADTEIEYEQCGRALDAIAAAAETPAQPHDELRDAPPAASENSADQLQPEADALGGTYDGDFDAADPLLTAFEDDHIVERAPLIDAQTCEEVDPRVSWQQDEPEPDGYAPVVDAEPTTDLWQQGYNDKLNGYEPSLSEPDYLRGYEARALIEREQGEGSTARMFAEGMIADADRHQEDQRSIVERMFDAFKSKEPA